MILAIILVSVLWCHLVSRYSIPGYLTQDSLYLPRVDSAARTFRILVTFEIDCEVRGISFFQIPWTILGRSSFEPKDHNKSALDEFSILHCESASPTLLHGLSGRNLLNLVRHVNLCIHNSERYTSSWVVPLHLYSDHRLSVDSQE